MKTKTIFGNCIQQTFYAMLRGFGSRLYVLKSRSILWPVHLCLKVGRSYYAFETTYQYEDYAPWWFEGRWRRLDADKVAQRRRFDLPYWAGIPFNLFLILLVIIPWVIAWAIYQPLFMLYWLVRGIYDKR